LAGAFDWLNSATKVFTQKTTNAVSVAASDYYTVANDYVLPAMDQWMTDLGDDILRKTGAEPVTTWGGVTATASVASFVLDPEIAIPQEIIKVSADSIVDSLLSLNGISPSTANTAHNIIDGLDAGLSLAESFAVDPSGIIKPAEEYAKFATDAVNDFIAGQDLGQSVFQIVHDALGNPIELKLSITPTNQSSGSADGALVYCIRLADSAAPAPTPQITYVTPNLSGEPVPQRQSIVIQGTGFLPNSLLEFNDGTTTYTNRIPTAVIPGQNGQSDEIDYNIAVGNDTANWTVTVINGSQRSAAFPFTVTAIADDGAAAAPIGIVAAYVGGIGSNVYAINWTNPSDSSGIDKVWYKLGSAPTSPTDGLSLDLDVGKPLFVYSPGSDQTVYVWLQDGAGNKDQTHASSVLLNADPSLPHVEITSPASTGTFSTNSNALLLTGTSFDLAADITSLSWANNRGGSGLLFGEANWSSGLIQLFDGTNILTVLAIDSLGHSSSVTLTVNFTAPTITDIWTGSSSNDWNDANNWSSGLVPTNGDNAAIFSGNVNVSSGVNASSLFVYGGAITWTAGEFDSTDVTIASGALVTLGGSGVKVISGGILNNAGTITWAGSDIQVENGAIINNLSGGVFDAQCDQTMYYFNGGMPTFNNAGTFRKSNSSGTTSVKNIIFNNTGSIVLLSGTTDFTGSIGTLGEGASIFGPGNLSAANFALNGNVSYHNVRMMSGVLSGTGTGARHHLCSCSIRHHACRAPRFQESFRRCRRHR
jgi:hypothetical protein